jgi:glutamine synthetase
MRIGDLESAGVRLAAMTMVDTAGITRVKIVPLRRLEAVARNGVGYSNIWAAVAGNDRFAAVAPWDSPSGDMRLVPDLEALQPLHAAPGYAWAPVRQLDQELGVMPSCQRSIVERIVARAATAGLSFQLTTELEMTLLRSSDGAPAHQGPGYSTQALVPLEQFTLDLCDALEAQGIPVEQMHPEFSPGQFEVSTAPADPVAAADRLVLLRITARQVAAAYGFDVSYAPVVIPGAVGNGAHLHLSVWRNGRNLLTGGNGAGGMTPEGASAMAGIVESLPALMAILAPTVPSYLRVQPGHWAGAFTCFGVENREASLRFVPGTITSRSQSANVEVKVTDGTANPYLAVAAVVTAALNGIERGLPEPPNVQIDPATLSADEQQRLGVHRLPDSLAAATDLLEASPLMRQMLGDAYHAAVVGSKRLEWQTYGAADAELVAAEHRFRY